MSEPVRDVLRKIHRWLGLALALPLLAQAATGLILVATPPFEAFRMPASRPFVGPPHTIAAIIAAAQFNEPGGLVPLRYQPGPTDHDTATVDLARPAERVPEARVFVNPGSLEVLEWRDRPDIFYRWAHGLHEYLLIAGPFGHGLVGWIGLGLLFLGLSGIPIWWPRRGRWKAALRVPFAARGYRFHRGLHGALGGWVAVLLIWQSLSGASMAFPGVFASLLGAPAARMPPSPRSSETHEIDPDAVANAARGVVHDAPLSSLRFPNQPGRPAIVTLQPDGSPPVVVFVDPANARVISIRDPAASTGANILAWARLLHSGEGFGPTWRAIVFSIGIALPVFPMTGVAMWLSRRRDRRRNLARQSVFEGASE